MSLRVTATDCNSRRNANLLHDGYDFVAQEGLAPNVFITVRWDETAFRLNPFFGLQKLLEKLRKLKRTGPCVYFWSREREGPDDTEHVHIAILAKIVGLKALRDTVCRWVGSDNSVSAVDVRFCKNLERCDAETLVKQYFLKGLPRELRPEYGIRKQTKPQGVIFGKRVGVSQDVSRGIRGLKNLTQGRRETVLPRATPSGSGQLPGAAAGFLGTR
jgi:hypothetical protein